MPSALVLAAGLGTRLDPLTRLVAKPAVPLGDRTLIEHVLAWVRRQGITDVVINLHHRPESLTAIVGDGAHLGLRVRYSWEREVLGSAGGPRHALPLVTSDPFVIINGDTLCDFDLGPMLAAHAASGADVTLAVVPNPAPDRYNGLVLDGDIVTGVVPRGAAAAGTWHFLFAQVAAAHLFAGLRDGVPAETIRGIYGDLMTRSPGRVRAWRMQAPFVDVGTPRDYLDAALRMGAAAHGRRSIVWPGAAVDPGADLQDCIVAGDVRVAAGLKAKDKIIIPADAVRDGDEVVVEGDMALFDIEPRHPKVRGS